MKKLFKPVAIGLAVSLLFSCDPKKEGAADGKVVINATDKMSAQELADSAEQVVSPYSFMMAYRLTSMALEKDPENTKALFYNKLLKRFEAFRGFYSRIKAGLNAEQQAELQKKLNAFPNSPLKEFLTAPGTDLKTVEDFQGLIGQYFTAVSEFRQFLKDKENSEMQIYLNPLLFAGAIRAELANSCRLNNQSSDSMQIECDYSYAAAKKLNIADFIALRQMAAGEMIIGLEYNSYSLEGLREAAQQKKSSVRVMADGSTVTQPSSESLTAKQQWELLFKNEKFGKLRSDNLWPKFKDIGSDLGAAVSWALQYKSTLCPKGYPSPDNRPNYLIRNGICIENSSELNRALALLDSALKGVIQVDLNNGNTQYNTRIDAFAWSRNPVADLRSIQPEFDASGNIPTGFKDNTLGGIFVDGNADKILLGR